MDFLAAMNEALDREELVYWLINCNILFLKLYIVLQVQTMGFKTKKD